MSTFDLETIKSFQKSSYLTPESKIGDYNYVNEFKDNDSGLKCVLYQNEDTKKYVVAFTGFNPVYSIKDVENIINFTNGENPSQVTSALQILSEQQIAASDIDLITGQSLGGAISQVIGSLEAYKNVQVVTINPIGGGNVVNNIADEFKSNDSSNIKNYICDQDDATKWSSQIGEKVSLPTYGFVDQLYDFANRGSYKDSEEIATARVLAGLIGELLAHNDPLFDYIKKNKTSLKELIDLVNDLWQATKSFSKELLDQISYYGDATKNFIKDKFSKSSKTFSIQDLLYLSRDIDMSEDMINDLHSKYNGYRGKFWGSTNESNVPHDPIIFDLNGDNVLETTNTTNGVFFDHDNDGFAEASAWVGENDGILVVDSNNNGQIDNGTELLTAETIASFDSNNDGIIDANDADFNNLKILKGDGTLMTLTEAGITSINLNTTQTDITDENGNQQMAIGSFTRTDSTTGRSVQKVIAFAPNKIHKLKKKLKKIA